MHRVGGAPAQCPGCPEPAPSPLCLPDGHGPPAAGSAPGLRGHAPPGRAPPGAHPARRPPGVPGADRHAAVRPEAGLCHRRAGHLVVPAAPGQRPALPALLLLGGGPGPQARAAPALLGLQGPGPERLRPDHLPGAARGRRRLLLLRGLLRPSLGPGPPASPRPLTPQPAPAPRSLL